MYNDNQLYQYIGKKIRESRSLPTRKLTQSELAKVCNVTFQQIQKYEKGTNNIPIHNLIKISKYTKKSLLSFIPLESAYTVDKSVDLSPADTDSDVREFIETKVFRNP
jgi:transcriptional regulator with XRE-family HTH domain